MGKRELYHSELLLPLPIATSSGNLLWLCYGCVLIARRERHLEKEASLGGVVQIGYQTPKSDLLVICIYRVVLPKTWRFKEFSSSIGGH